MALVLVAWAAAVGTAIVLGISFVTRIDVQAAASQAAAVRSRAAAESAVWYAVYGLVSGNGGRLPTNTTPVHFEYDGIPVTILVQAQAGLVDLNRASYDLIRAAMEGALERPALAITFADAVKEWRTNQGRMAISNAASANTAVRVFRTHEVLRQLPAISDGEYGQIAPLFTVHSTAAGVAVDVAPEWVLTALSNAGTAAAQERLNEDRRGSMQTAEERTSKAGSTRAISGGFEILVEARTKAANARLSATVVIDRSQTPPYSIVDWREGWYDRMPDQYYERFDTDARVH